MKDKQTFDEILTEFAQRDTAGYIVWGQKLDAAHKREMAYRALIAGVSLADAVDEAHKRELAMKDDERLTIAAKDAEIARLRKPTPVDDDLLKMARDIEKLNAKLKVAEDALVSIADEEIDDDYSTVAEIALAAIRK